MAKLVWEEILHWISFFDSKNIEYAKMDAAFSRRVNSNLYSSTWLGPQKLLPQEHHAGCIQRNAGLDNGSSHWEETHTAG